MATKKSTGEEVVNHYGLVRLRVNGSASLVSTLYSLDKTQSDSLAPLTLNSTTNIEPTILSNFTQQRAKLQIKTVNLGEWFQISRVVIYVKAVAKSYPQ